MLITYSRMHDQLTMCHGFRCCICAAVVQCCCSALTTECHAPSCSLPDPLPQGLTYFPDDKMELKDMLCRWTPAFSKTLMCHLRKDNDLGEELRVRGRKLWDAGRMLWEAAGKQKRCGRKLPDLILQ